MVQSAEQKGIVIILKACGLVNKSKNVLSLVNLLLSLGHSGLLVDYYLFIIDKGRAQQALYINWLCSHISDEDIISPCNIETIKQRSDENKEKYQKEGNKFI